MPSSDANSSWVANNGQSYSHNTNNDTYLPHYMPWGGEAINYAVVESQPGSHCGSGTGSLGDNKLQGAELIATRESVDHVRH